MKDVLLPIGSIVDVENTNDELLRYMIIGKRCINHESLRAWDYISIPYEEGFKRKIEVRDGKVTNYDNFFYFNHHEIDKVVFTPDENSFTVHKEEIDDI